MHELVRVLARLLEEDWGRHPVFGQGTLNCGLIAGGLAANVVAPEASAALMARVVEDPRAVEERIRRHLTGAVEFAAEKSYGPVEFHVPAAHARDAPVVAFGTDAPWLTRFGASRGKRFAAAALGGFLILFGARLAGGCTSGHILSGVSQLAVSSLLFFVAAFGVAMLAARALFPDGAGDPIRSR